VFPFAVNGLLAIMTVLLVIYGYKFNYIIKVTVFFAIEAVLMILLPLGANYLDADAGFAVSVFILLIFGFSNGVLQGTVFGMGGMFPPKYIGAIMFGNGLSGMSVTVLKAIAMLIFPVSD